MTELLQEIEDQPAAWPPTPNGLFDVTPHPTETFMPLDPAVIWSRIEAWISHRWTARNVTWVVEGPGDFNPPLTPVNSATTECWDGAAWVAETLTPSPLGGYQLPGEGPYRIVASVGGGTVPEVVNQAFRRLHDYFGETPGRRLQTEEAHSIGPININTSRPEHALRRAMNDSGCADLLRPYRRVK